MPKNEAKSATTEKSPAPKAAKKIERVESVKDKEPAIKIQAFDPADKNSDSATKSKPGRKRTNSPTSTPPPARLTLVPPKTELQAQSSSPAPRKRSPKGSNSPKDNFHKNDKLPSISPGAKQEIYGILLIVFGLIFFFGLFAQKGIIADAGLAVRRIFGLASYLIPFLVAFIGLTFLIEGLAKREFINQVKLLGGILSIFAFVNLVQLLDPNPRQLAEQGGGGGYVGYYLTSFLAGLLQGIGAFLLLAALFIIGLIIAFNISLNNSWRVIQNYFRRIFRLSPLRNPADFAREFEPDDDFTVINPNQHTRSYVVNRDRDELEENALLDGLLLGSGPTVGGRKPNVPPEISPAYSQPAVYGEHLSLPPHQPPVISQPATDKKMAQPWKRDEPIGPAPAELPHIEWILPKINMLANFNGVEVNEKDLLKKAKKIEETLASFGVEAVVREVNTGPTVTQYALEPGFGVKVARITSLSNDLALALAAPAIRIEAPVPGQQRVGVEVPNLKTATVGMKEIMESEEFVKRGGKLKIALGRDVAGQPMVADLAKMPHLLIAGATGSGKSVCINSIIAAFLFQYRPDELKFIMVDPKMVELSTYNGIPHLAFPVVTQIEADPDRERERGPNGERIPTVMSVLKWTIREMEKRYKRLSLVGHRNIESYNKAAGVGNDWENIPYLVLIIDELADLMMVAPDEAESSICRLAQKARAVGIHLILATQRPSVDVVTGLIKANFPTRMTFAVTSQIDSRVILDSSGAEKLLGRGDMLYLPSDAAKPQRIQGVYVSDEEIDHLVSFWQKQSTFLEGNPQNFVQGQIWPKDLREIETEADDVASDGTDQLFEQALQLVRENRTASVSLLQRRLRIGYNRAATLIEQLESAGVIGHSEAGKPRPVLLEEEDFVEPTSLTAAASAFEPIPVKPAESSRNTISNPALYKPVTPALNAQAKKNERQQEAQPPSRPAYLPPFYSGDMSQKDEDEEDDPPI